MTQYAALTAYGVTIPKYLPDRKAAMHWARTQGHGYPGCRVVQKTSTGLRTIWRQPATTIETVFEQVEREAA